MQSVAKRGNGKNEMKTAEKPICFGEFVLVVWNFACGWEVLAIGKDETKNMTKKLLNFPPEWG